MAMARNLVRFPQERVPMESREGGTAKLLRFTGHRWHHCTREHCVTCEGGLALCVTCGGAECSLTTHCPGRRMEAGYADAVCAGVLDYRDGRWTCEEV